MALHVDAGAERPVVLAAPPAAVWARLADVPAWRGLFPNVASVVPHPGAPDVFVSTMTPMGPPGYAVAAVYACRYTFSPEGNPPGSDGGTIAWVPAEDLPDVAADARFSGRLALASDPAGGTRGTLRLSARLEIPAPRFARALVEPVVRLAVGHTVDTFLARLADAVRAGGEGGAAGRA